MLLIINLISAAKNLAMQNKKRRIGVIFHVQEDYKNYAVQEGIRGIKDAAEEIKDSGLTFLIQIRTEFQCGRSTEEY